MAVFSFEGADSERTIDAGAVDGDGSAVDARQAPLPRESSPTESRNVADGTKNRVPVTARLKSSSRS